VARGGSVGRVAVTQKIDAFLAERRNLILAGIRRDGRPQLSPNWFYWDGERFYVSTLRSRAKYAVFRRDPRAQLLVDDPTGFRAVLTPATVEIREDLASELPRFRAIREKYGVPVPDEAEQLRRLTEEGRVLLAITPDGPPDSWICWGLD
jgi:PPOX class probable F420-dependent enzyme